jgi:hypothetical protein
MLPLTEEVRALGARLLGQDLIVFPVRHHSPACAWHLRHLLERDRPSVILVEGPRSFTPTIPFLVHPDARMPLAIYTYAVQKATGATPLRRRAAYYPFCGHSPELVALQYAYEHGIPARFIDLDFSEQCQIEIDAEDTEARSLLDERHYKRSQYLQALAQQIGCRDHEELWEHLIEVPAATRSIEAHVADLAAYCHLARLESTSEELQADGTLTREAEMLWHIRQAIDERKSGEGPVLAVLGGFHAVVIPDLLASGAVRPNISRSAISEESSALIRYSFDRLDRLNGYSAGMTSPAWHQKVWERMIQREKAGVDTGPAARREVTLDLLYEIAAELRERHGVSLPMPALAAAYEHALQLAVLRQRLAPVREDVLDAVRSCFIKGDMDGDGALVLAVAHRVLSGQNMGKVPPGASTPPLVKDFEYRVRRQRLRIEDSQPRRAVLDIYRRPEHRTTSRLFHGLVLLGVPFGSRTAGPDFVNGIGLERLQEHWEYARSAATEAALVEASIFGVTVPLAVAGRFTQHLEQIESGAERRDAATAASVLVRACVLGLHDHLPRIIELLRGVAAMDPDFGSVAAAAGTIALLWESREPLEARGIEGLPTMLAAVYQRAIYLGNNPGSGDANGIVGALIRLRELLASEAGKALDASLYWALLKGLSSGSDNANIRGGAAGLLYSAGWLSDTELGIALDGHLNGLLQPRDAVGFLRGLLQTAREAAWQQSALLKILDGLMAAWDDETFVANLPEMRLAFSAMTPKETDRIAAAVGQLYGVADLGRLVNYDLSPEQLQANLGHSLALTEVLTADGLQAWIRP